MGLPDPGIWDFSEPGCCHQRFTHPSAPLSLVTRPRERAPPEMLLRGDRPARLGGPLESLARPSDPSCPETGQDKRARGWQGQLAQHPRQLHRKHWWEGACPKLQARRFLSWVLLRAVWA